MKKIINITAFLISGFIANAQQDSLKSLNLEEVVITATRTERKLSNVAVPVQLINKKTILQSGSVRLNNILEEQTGLFITNASGNSSAGGGIFGNGIQIQGLSPDYTMVLIDGEPIIGRQGGVLNLSRLTVANIKRIEIVKGPSSSLYGSEAMGGVVNIITEQPQQNDLNASIRYGRFNSMDASIKTAINKENWGIQFFGNRYRSDGFDLDKTTLSKTIDPFSNYTGQIRFHYHAGPKTRLSLSARYFDEVQNNFFQAQDNSNNGLINIAGDGKVKDLNLNPVISQQFGKNVKFYLRGYYSRYQFNQDLLNDKENSVYYHDFFQQEFSRIENQTDIKWSSKNVLNAGAGFVKEKLNTTRYSGERTNDIGYGFLQNEWKPRESFTLIAGIRYDNNSRYQSKFSPKLAVQIKPNNKLRLNASYGAGFKAPDFRQLFLNFLNSAGGGYVIYGANEINIQELESQKQAGIITDILPRAYHLALLKPETSNGWNAGLNYELNGKNSFSLNLFRNDIKNLIQNDLIAFRNNGAGVYSYFNVKEAFTQGMELQYQTKLNKELQLSGGYQFLITADKDDLRKIKAGNLYTRSITTNETRLVNRSDYAGLPNRSTHMLNAKLFYDNQQSGWGGSFRTIYRSRWGTFDKDGNGIINRSDEFAKGYLQVNLAVSKSIQSFSFQAGIDNLLNYKDVLNMPGQPGIQPYLSISYSFINNHKNL